MTQAIRLKFKSIPKALGELAHSNQFLKISAFYAYGLCLLLAAIIFYQAMRPPVIISLAPDASIYQRSELPLPEVEVKAAVKEYLNRRYKWDPPNVGKQLQSAQAFILPATRKTFETAVGNVARFSVEKVVSQRVHPEKISVNLDRRTVSITGDRVTSIQGLKAAGDLKLELAFDFGPRTAENPWGIYVTKEREE